MQAGVMIRIGRLMPQKKAIRPGRAEAPVAAPAAFAYGQGQRAVRPGRLDGRNQVDQHVIGEPRVFAALEHKGAKAQFITIFTAV